VRFLEIHETRAHALGGRLMRDLGDCVLLHAPRPRSILQPRGRTPLAGVPDAFDQRLAEILALFVGLRPSAPRLDVAGVRPARPRGPSRRLRLPGSRWGLRHAACAAACLPSRAAATRNDSRETPRRTRRHGREDAIRDIGRVLVESFRVEQDDREPIEAETNESFRSARSRSASSAWTGAGRGRQAVHVRRREHTSRRSARGPGTGAAATGRSSRTRSSAICRWRAIRSPGAFADNDRAIELYRRAGLEIPATARATLLSSGDHQVVGR
jgi:hypothetical protein